MSSYTSVSRVAKLHYLVPGSTEESMVDLREIAIMLLADATANEVEDSDFWPNFNHLSSEFVHSGEDICKTFMDTMLDAGIDIEPELVAAEALALKIIESIDAHLKGGFTFEEMYKTSKIGAHRQVVSAFGYGVSFWDDHRPEDFGQDKHGRTVGCFESCYDEAYMLLTKLVAHREQNP